MASIVVLGVDLRAGAVLQVQGNILLEVCNLPRRLKILCCLSRTEKVINISVLGYIQGIHINSHRGRYGKGPVTFYVTIDASISSPCTPKGPSYPFN